MLSVVVFVNSLDTFFVNRVQKEFVRKYQRTVFKLVLDHTIASSPWHFSMRSNVSSGHTSSFRTRSQPLAPMPCSLSSPLPCHAVWRWLCINGAQYHAAGVRGGGMVQDWPMQGICVSCVCIWMYYLTSLYMIWRLAQVSDIILD